MRNIRQPNDVEFAIADSEQYQGLTMDCSVLISISDVLMYLVNKKSAINTTKDGITFASSDAATRWSITLTPYY